ncbi:hypothetical protein F4780DRAFT_724088 [Xylariomycetidae sp. FL0641]|nr:hypothetical protein F4780DRAFT_724088 [Xylariomycetidae sp. FL0641]
MLMYVVPGRRTVKRLQTVWSIIIPTVPTYSCPPPNPYQDRTASYRIVSYRIFRSLTLSRLNTGPVDRTRVRSAGCLDIYALDGRPLASGLKWRAPICIQPRWKPIRAFTSPWAWHIGSPGPVRCGVYALRLTGRPLPPLLTDDKNAGGFLTNVGTQLTSVPFRMAQHGGCSMVCSNSRRLYLPESLSPLHDHAIRTLHMAETTLSSGRVAVCPSLLQSMTCMSASANGMGIGGLR